MEDLVQVLFVYTVPFIGLIVLIRWYARRREHTQHSAPLPPGPKPLPIFGNIFDLPALNDWPWLKYAEWSKKYDSDILHAHVFGQPIIIVNSLKVADELLEKRSLHYSGREANTMAVLSGWSWNMGMMDYGPEWRKHRKAIHRAYFETKSLDSFKPLQQARVREWLQRLLGDPEDWVEISRHLFGSIILEATYGLPAPPSSPLITLNRALEGPMQTFITGSFLVDHLPFLQYIPFLRYLPASTPVLGFARRAEEFTQITSNARGITFDMAKNALDSGQGNGQRSVVKQLLEDIDVLQREGKGQLIEEEERIAKNVTAMAYIAGVDTSLNVTRVFIYAMTLHPLVVKAAQAELDAVVGPTRLPTFNDRPSLPYINAILKECLRWQHVVPLSPRKSTKEDIYEGWRIPKGSIVIPNFWSILHDPEVYTDPDAFIPERFIKNGALDPEIRDPEAIAFGFGRRNCPGRLFGANSLFITIASMLHVFDIRAPVDPETGLPAMPSVKMTSGFGSHPEDFKCVIEPRSEAARVLIGKAVFGFLPSFPRSFSSSQNQKWETA